MVEIKKTVDSCLSCPFFEKHSVTHWLLGNQKAWAYHCKEAKRQITPQDGVNPPPEWCPFLHNNLLTDK